MNMTDQKRREQAEADSQFLWFLRSSNAGYDIPPGHRTACVCNSLRKFETPPTIPRQEIERKGKREGCTGAGQRETYTTHRVQWGEGTVQETPALHYTGLLDNPFSNSELRASTPSMREE